MSIGSSLNTSLNFYSAF